MKPNSSAVTEKMKSEWRTRRKWSWFCEPRNRPRPSQPPEPMLIIACSML